MYMSHACPYFNVQRGVGRTPTPDRKFLKRVSQRINQFTGHKRHVEEKKDLLWGYIRIQLVKSKTALCYQPKPLGMEFGKGHIRQQATTSL